MAAIYLPNASGGNCGNDGASDDGNGSSVVLMVVVVILENIDDVYHLRPHSIPSHHFLNPWTDCVYLKYFSH